MNDSYIKKAILVIILILGVVFLSGCADKTKESLGGEKAAGGDVTETTTTTLSEALLTPKDRAARACQALCNELLSSGEDLSNGPCLSNEVIEDWVCDVAHHPRESIDNDPANQCSAYIAGTARHFVEVDTGCDFVKAV